MLVLLLHALTDAVAAAACVGEFEFGRSFFGCCHLQVPV